MPLPQEKTFTVHDIYDLPEGTRAELIDGQIHYMSLPSRKHQEILLELAGNIHNYIKSKKGPCKLYIAPFAVFLDEDNRNYIEPDLSIICAPEKLTDKGCAGAPDWIIEIVSPGSRRMDYSIKLFKYRSAHVREYWIVDPDKNRITVHDLIYEDVKEYTFSDSIKPGIYEDFIIDFKQITI